MLRCEYGRSAVECCPTSDLNIGRQRGIGLDWTGLDSTGNSGIGGACDDI